MRLAVASLLLAMSLAVAGCGGVDGVDERELWALQHPGPCDERIARIEADIASIRSTIRVFVRESDAGRVQEIASELRRIDGVATVTAVTKEEALERAAKLFEDSPDVMENLPGNPFPASVDVRVDPDRAERIRDAVADVPGVDYVEGGDNRAVRFLQRFVDEYRTGDPTRVCGAVEAMEPTSGRWG